MEFARTEFVTREQRLEISNRLVLTDRQVKIWFQNRRNKWKRQIAADSEASNLRAIPGVPLFLQVNFSYYII